MNKINILHLSDLHFGTNSTKFIKKELIEKKNEILNKLLEKIKDINLDWKPDIVVISGDIGFAGKEGDYKKAWSWIKKLLIILDIGPERVVVSAGNHDRNLQDENCKIIPKGAKEADNLLEDENLNKFLSPFNAFISFKKNNNILPLIFKKKNQYLIGYKEILNLRFVVLNSAWFSKGGSGDEKKMYIGLPPIDSLIKEGILRSPDMNTNIIISVLHHPPEWLHQHEQDKYEDRQPPYVKLAKNCDFIFSGHTHGEELFEPDKKHGGAFLFKAGTVYDSKTRIYNCEILRIDTDDRIADRLKIYFNRELNDWSDEIDENNPYIFSNDISRLKHNSNNILNQIYDKIGKSCKVQRNKILTEIEEKIINNDITFITGEAMVGKSVILKDLASNLNPNQYFIFNIGRFKSSNLNQYLKSLNIIEDFKNILTSIKTEDAKYIIIDEVERIRESEDKLIVFKDLISNVFTLNLESNLTIWKIILCCRSEYFQNVYKIIEKLGKELNLLRTNKTIQPFDSGELNQVKEFFPKLESLIPQPHLEKLIKIPKILDILTFENFNIINEEIVQKYNYTYYTETYLMEQFWKQIIRNNEQISSSNLSPEERDRFLQKISSHILSNSTPYLITEADNDELYQSLISERILKRTNNQLSFTHDVFEEWALVRYIIGRPDTINDFLIIFNGSKRIGRSFQLFSRYLIEILNNPDRWKTIYNSIEENNELNPIWKQDLIYGLLKSEILYEILPILKDIFLIEENKVLKEIFKLIPIKCVIFEENFKPDVNIWFPIILYVIDNLFTELSDKSLLLYSEIVKKWFLKFGIQVQEFFDKILARYIEFSDARIIIEDNKNDLSYRKKLSLKKNILFTTLWGFFYKSEEIILFLDKVIESKESKQIFEEVLFNMHGYMFLCKHSPEYALKVLKYYLIKKKEIPERIDRYLDPFSFHSFFKDFYYEIESPFYKFLNYHEDNGLNLIHEIINHATKIWIITDQPLFYGPSLNRFSNYRTPISQKIQLHDEELIEVWGDEDVYSWFMPLGMCPRIVNFALSALEKWIFEQISNKNRDPSEIITKVLKNTISFSTIAVSIISILHLFNEGKKTQLNIDVDNLIKSIQPLIEKSAFWNLDLTRSIKYGIGLRDYRSLNLESLFTYIKFHLNDEELKNRLLSKIRKFPEEIFFFFEEEKTCKDLLINRFAHIRRLSEQTKDENWYPVKINEQNALQFILPKELENKAEKDYHEEFITLISINNWIYSSFEASEIKPQYNLEQLLKYIEELIKKDEEIKVPRAFNNLSADRAEVITGFFALLILYNWEFLQKNNLEQKAKDIILRAIKRPQALGYIKASVSIYPMGYKRSAARAIPILYFKYSKGREIKKAILKLTKYHNNQVRNFLFTHLALIWKENCKIIWKCIQNLFKESLKRGIINKKKYYIINPFVKKEHGFSPEIQFQNVKKIDLMKLYIKRSLEICKIKIKNKDLEDLNPKDIDIGFFSSVLNIFPQDSKILDILPKDKVLSLLESIFLFTINGDIFNKNSYENNNARYHFHNPNFHFYEIWGNKALSIIGNITLFLELDKVKKKFINPILSLWKNSENIMKVFLRELILVSKQPNIEKQFVDIWYILADHIFNSLLDKEKISYEIISLIFFQDNYGNFLKKNFELETSIKQLDVMIRNFLNNTTYYYPILKLVNQLKNPLLCTTAILILYIQLRNFSFNEEKHIQLRRELFYLIDSYWTTFQEKIKTDPNYFQKIQYLIEVLIEWGEPLAGKLQEKLEKQL